MKAPTAIGAILFALAGSVQGMSWSMCGHGPFSTSTVQLTPDPPQVGSDVEFRIEGTYDPEGALREQLSVCCAYAAGAVLAFLLVLSPERLCLYLAAD